MMIRYFHAIKETAAAMAMLIVTVSSLNAATREADSLNGLNSAINSSGDSGDIILLTADIENNTSSAVTINGKEITLDLNGHTISSGAKTTLLNVQGAGAKLTVTDSNTNKEGVLTNTAGYPAIQLKETGSLNLIKGNIKSESGTAVDSKGGGDIYVSGGSITGSSCVYNNSEGNITVTGGSLEALGYSGTAIYDVTSSGKISISGDASLSSNSPTNGTVTVIGVDSETFEVLNVSGGSITNKAAFGYSIDSKCKDRVRLSGSARIGLVSIPTLYISGNLSGLTIHLSRSTNRMFYISAGLTDVVTIDGTDLSPDDTANGKVAAFAADPSYIDESKFRLTYLPDRKVIRNGSYLVFANASGLENNSISTNTVFTYGNSIVVRPSQPGETITVYGINGNRICKQQCPDSELAIPVNEAGIYFVKISSETTKVIVK